MIESNERILVVAGEASGDLHGGTLVQALKQIQPTLEFEGVGGKHLQEAGLHTLFNIDRMGGMGIFEYVTTLWHHLKIFQTLSREIRRGRYRAAILINYPLFNLRLAKVLKAHDCPVYFFISPQVWASRKNRVHTIAQTGKKMYVILPFEEPLYKEVGVDVEFLGHPFIDIVKPRHTREDAFREFGLNPDTPTVGLMPGSRMSEIDYLFDDIVGAARRIQKDIPDCQFLLPVADTIDPELIRDRLRKLESPQTGSSLNIKIVTGQNYDVMQCSDCLIIASGSATLEAGLLGCPMVIVYKVHPLTYFIFRLLTDIRIFGLINIVAGELVVPELLNEQVNPEAIAAKALPMLTQPETNRALRERLRKVRESLGTPGVVDRIAQSIVDSLNQPSHSTNEKISI